MYHLQGLGIEHAFYTTQISNHGTIRLGERLGFRVARGEYVVRLLL